MRGDGTFRDLKEALESEGVTNTLSSLSIDRHCFQNWTFIRGFLV